jgi:uncharacterized protein YndB with AHSA1/START domain
MTGTDTPTGTTSDRIVLERTLDAPPDLVWRMWTEPEHFAEWYGPGGATIPVAEMDVTVGGRRRVAMEMSTPDGTMRMWFVGEFREIDRPNRLVYTESVADEHGNVLSPEQMGMPADHPAVTEVVVELAAVAPDRTRLTLTHLGVPAGSPGEAGWRMALDALTARLAAGG